MTSRYSIEDTAQGIELFRAKLGFPPIKPPNNIDKIVSECGNLEVLSNIDPIRLAEYSVILAQYSFYLASEVNRLEAKAKWCESNIQNIVGKNINNISGYFNEKQSYIRSNDEHAMRLDEIRQQSQTEYECFKFLSEKIKFLSGSLDNLVRAKINMRRQNEY